MSENFHEFRYLRMIRGSFIRKISELGVQPQKGMSKNRIPHGVIDSVSCSTSFDNGTIQVFQALRS